VSNDEDLCKPSKFCDVNNKISYEVDENADYSLQNWIHDFDLVCASSLTISSFASLFFMGFAFGSLFIPKLSDKYGRKKLFYICMLV